MHLLARMNAMLDFICMGPVEPPGARKKRQLQNETFLSTVGFKPTPGSSSLQIHHLTH